MPITTKNRSRYPADWDKIAIKVRTNARNKCQFCRIRNKSLYLVIDGVNTVISEPGDGCYERILSYWKNKEDVECYGEIYKLKKIVLTVAHMDHTPENCELSNLKALCQKCHNNYDIEHRKKNRKLTMEKKK